MPDEAGPCLPRPPPLAATPPAAADKEEDAGATAAADMDPGGGAVVMALVVPLAHAPDCFCFFCCEMEIWYMGCS